MTTSTCRSASRHAKAVAQAMDMLYPYGERDRMPYTIHHAAKNHGACWRCRDDIEAHDDYVRTVVGFPWDREADVDDEGRTIDGGPIGTWAISKEHVDCLLRRAQREHDDQLAEFLAEQKAAEAEYLAEQAAFA